MDFANSRSAETLEASLSHTKPGEILPLATLVILRCCVEQQIIALGARAYPDARECPKEVSDLARSVYMLCRAQNPAWDDPANAAEIQNIAANFRRDLEDFRDKS